MTLSWIQGAPSVQDTASESSIMSDSTLMEDDDAEPQWFREIKREDESGA